ncbi:hypothetical protein LDENG_00205020 [Lucifuga dentata]|nr:hypothetical protein LDENG_00205020 [Lucifuga dentata]
MQVLFWDYIPRWRHTFTLHFLLRLNAKITKKKNLNTHLVHNDGLPKNVSSINKLIFIAYQNELKPMVVWKVGKKKNHHSSSMLWEMTISNLTCMKIEYIRLKHAKWVVGSFKIHQMESLLYWTVGRDF